MFDIFFLKVLYIFFYIFGTFSVFES